jgi:hypothetical protein
MPKASAVRQYPIGVEELLDTVKTVGIQFGYKVKARSGSAIRLSQPFSLFSFTYPATIKVTTEPAGQGLTAGFLVTNFGWGPIQSRHVQAQLERFLSALEIYMSRRNPVV